MILAVLGMLRTEQYGYTMRKGLAEYGLAVDEGTLYPLLRRLETQGLLLSQWREEGRRNKRFYRLSSDGELILERLLVEWQDINASLNGILGRGPDEGGEDGTEQRVGRPVFTGGQVLAAKGGAG